MTTTFAGQLTGHEGTGYITCLLRHNLPLFPSQTARLQLLRGELGELNEFANALAVLGMRALPLEVAAIIVGITAMNINIANVVTGKIIIVATKITKIRIVA